MQQRAAVGDRLAAGPAELLDDVGHRLGQHDVAGGDREPVAQPPHLAGGGVDRHRRGARAHAAARGLGDDAARAVDVQRASPASPRRSARRGRAAARAARTPAARGGRSRPSASPRRCGTPASRRPRASPPASAPPRSRRRPRRRWRRPGPARRRRRGAAPRAPTRRPPAPRTTRRPCRPSPPTPSHSSTRPPLAVLLGHQRPAQPQRGEEAAVAPARPGAALRRLEDHHARVRLALEHLPRRPHAGVAAADDHDVGVELLGQRRLRGRQPRLGDPPAVRVVLHAAASTARDLDVAQPARDVAADRVLGEARRQPGQPLEDREVGGRQVAQRVAALEEGDDAPAAALVGELDRAVGPSRGSRAR